VGVNTASLPKPMMTHHLVLKREQNGIVLQGDLGLGRRRGEEQETEHTGDSEIPDFILHALSSVMEVSLLRYMQVKQAKPLVRNEYHTLFHPSCSCMFDLICMCKLYNK